MERKLRKDLLDPLLRLGEAGDCVEGEGAGEEGLQVEGGEGEVEVGRCAGRVVQEREGQVGDVEGGGGGGDGDEEAGVLGRGEAGEVGGGVGVGGGPVLDGEVALVVDLLGDLDDALPGGEGEGLRLPLQLVHGDAQAQRVHHVVQVLEERQVVGGRRGGGGSHAMRHCFIIIIIIIQ